MSGSVGSQTPDHFPYDLYGVPCVKQSDEKYIQQHKKESLRNIIIGGFRFNADETEFYELFLTKDTTEPGYITWKSFNKDYNKLNADLRKISFDSGDDVNSFLIDNQYILIEANTTYNVYDITKDEWLLNKYGSFHRTLSSYHKAHLHWTNSSSVIINDQFYILSLGNDLYFFLFGTTIVSLI